MKLGSLFAGIGGIEIGFQNAGISTAWAIEIDKNACETYKLNHKNKIINDDIKNVDLDKLDKINILSAGFPCQAFSIAGYKKGFQDARGNVFFEILRYLEYFKPQIIFLENVKNLVNHDKGDTFSTIKNKLEKLGYHIKYQVLNTAEYSNIPQNRERIYIVGFLNKKHFEQFRFPNKIKLNQKITDLLEKKVDKTFYYNQTKYYHILKESMNKKDTIYQWRRVYVRENKNNLCPTLTANMGTGGHNVPLILDDDIRKLTPRECARFQGFDDKFKFPNLAKSALYKQIGNSVSVGVVENIAKEIIRAIK